MKVCTDACIFGAWFSNKVREYNSILDIGCGTGLLMLMLAQKCKSEIHGIELDLHSFKQLQENSSNNKWHDRLKVFYGDARSHVFPRKYDFIISNPPFFENDLPSASESNNLAKHSTQLTLEELLQSIDINLSYHGSFGILLPFDRFRQFDELAGVFGFFCTERLFLKQSSQHLFFRAILSYSRNKEQLVPSFELIIKNTDQSYTSDCIALLKEYYLAF
jgi:tRNA1Val (adenine37-N6)-methyltransferase